MDAPPFEVAAGRDADFAVIDEEETWTVRASDTHNLNRYTPLEGKTLAGRVTATYVRGVPVYERDTDGSESFGATGLGRRVRRGRWHVLNRGECFGGQFFCRHDY